MNILFFIAVAFLVGVCMPTQAGLNVQLTGIFTRHPLITAFFSFLVGSATLLAISLALRLPFPEPSGISQTSWWHWVGGCLGAFIVAGSIFAGARLGATTLIVLNLSGMLATSVLLDHFGLLGFPVRPATLARLTGLVFVFTGVLLVSRY